jgi:phage/plasmid-like protein (TIGR03299 family)
MMDTILTTHWGQGESLDLGEVEKLFSWDAVESTMDHRLAAASDYEVPGDRAKGIAAAIEAAADHGDWAQVADLCRQMDETVTGETIIRDETRKGVVKPPNGDGGLVLGVHGKDRPTGQYRESLLRNAEMILGDSLTIMSAGLLYSGGVAFVQVTTPETITTKSGIEFSPFLTATDSHNGMYAQRYDTGNGIIICRNTHAAFLKDAKGTYKLKHTKKAEFVITDSHEALGIVHTVGGHFASKLDELYERKVTPAQWDAFVDAIAPLKGEDARSDGRTEKRRENLYGLYASDERVAPWKDTALGVMLAMNTEAHWLSRVNKDRDRDLALAERSLRGDFSKLDVATLNKLDAVLATA